MPWSLFVEYILWLIVLVIIFKGYDKLINFEKTKKDFVFAHPKTEALWSFAVVGAMFIFTLILVAAVPKQDANIQHFGPGQAFGQAFGVGLIFSPLWIVLAARKQSFQSLGFHRHNLGKSLGLVVLFFASKILFEVIVHHKHIRPQGEYIWGVFYFLSVGFGEEALFRGYFQTHLGNWIGKWKGLFIASLAFALVHVPHRLMMEGLSFPTALLFSILSTLPGALFLGWIFLVTKNISAPILIHALIEEPLDPFLFE